MRSDHHGVAVWIEKKLTGQDLCIQTSQFPKVKILSKSKKLNHLSDHRTEKDLHTYAEDD